MSPANPSGEASASRVATGKTTLIVVAVRPRALVLACDTGTDADADAAPAPGDKCGRGKGAGTDAATIGRARRAEPRPSFPSIVTSLSVFRRKYGLPTPPNTGSRVAVITASPVSSSRFGSFVETHAIGRDRRRRVSFHTPTHSGGPRTR